MSKVCQGCIHYAICKWCAENAVFIFPKDDGRCEMRNTDFDDVEDAVSNAAALSKKLWDEERKDTYDPTKAAFQKGRWSAFKDVLEIMSTKGDTLWKPRSEK